MKKRLLITSIVMMLVVAVALSTATYAWFTSSNNVTANSLTMTAAINEASALEISYVDTEGTWLTTIAAEPPTGSIFNPAAPNALTINSTYYSAITWGSSEVINGKFKATYEGAGEQYVWTDGDTQSFFLHNGSTANVINDVTMSATITGAAAPFIRIGVFKKDSTGYKLIGVISNLVNYEKATSFEGNYEFYRYDSTGPSNYYIKLSDEDLNMVTEDDAAAKTAADFAEAVETYGMIYKSAITVVEATAYEAGTTYYTDNAGNSEASGITDAETFASAKATNEGHLYKKTTDYAGVAVGSITGGTLVSSAITNPTICTKKVSVGSLAVNNNAQGGDDQMELRIAVWMDGTALNDDTASNANKSATIALNFEASR